MSTPWFRSEAMISGLRLTVAAEGAPTPEEVAAPPAEIADWLTGLRLLRGVPFAYLVPDAAMLPPESIRFFWLDRDWTDAAVEGALSAAGAYSMVRSQAAAADTAIRAALDQHERNTSPHVDADVEGTTPVGMGGGRIAARDDAVGGETYDTLLGGAEVVTGFLLRSLAVSGWPGLHVIPRRNGRDMTLLRIERLAPAVLLVLIDGCPDEVLIEEPRRQLQFGVDLTPGTVPPGTEDGDTHPAGHRRVRLRDPADGRPTDPPQRVGVPFRAGSTGVVDMAALAARVEDVSDREWAEDVSSAELTTQLLQFPYQQVFRGDGEDTGGPGVLHVTTPLALLDDLALIDDLD